MSIDIPPALQWISYLAGSKWPQGDEDGLWRIGEHWHASASEMSDLIPDLNRVRNETMSVITGETANTAEQEFAKLFDGDYSVDKLVEAMSALGETARQAGTQVEASKIEILVGLGMAAAEILYAIAMAPWTFGASMAWIPAIEAITMAAVRMLFNQLMRALVRRAVEALTKTAVARLVREVAKETAQEIAEELITNLAIQQYQIDKGHKDKIDWSDVGNAAKGAAAGGAAAGAFHGPAFGALGGKHGNGGIGNAFAGAGASYGAEVVAGVAGALAAGSNLDAGEIFAGGALGGLSGGIESSHGPGHDSPHGAPAGLDGGKSHAFDSAGNGPDGTKDFGGKGSSDTNLPDAAPSHQKSDPNGSPLPFDQHQSKGPSDGPEGSVSENSHDPDTAATGGPTASSAPQGGNGQTGESGSRHSANAGTEPQGAPQQAPADDQVNQSATQHDTGGSDTRETNTQQSTGSGQSGQVASEHDAGSSQSGETGSQEAAGSSQSGQTGSQQSPGGGTNTQGDSPQTSGDDHTNNSEQKHDSGSKRDGGESRSSQSPGDGSTDEASAQHVNGHDSPSDAQQPAPRGHDLQSTPQQESPEHSSSQPTPQQVSGETGSTTAGHHASGVDPDSPSAQHDSQSTQNSGPGPESVSHQATAPSDTAATHAETPPPVSQSPGGPSPESPNTDHGSPTQADPSPNDAPSANRQPDDAEALQDESHQVTGPPSGHPSHVGAAPSDTNGSASETAPPSTTTDTNTSPPPSNSSITPPPSTNPSTAATPPPPASNARTTGPPPTTGTQSTAQPGPSNTSTTPTAQNNATPPSSPSSTATHSSNTSGSTNPGAPAKSVSAGLAASSNPAPTAVSNVAGSPASSPASRSTRDELSQLVVGMLPAPTAPPSDKSGRPKATTGSSSRAPKDELHTSTQDPSARREALGSLAAGDVVGLQFAEDVASGDGWKDQVRDRLRDKLGIADPKQARADLDKMIAVLEQSRVTVNFDANTWFQEFAANTDNPPDAYLNSWERGVRPGGESTKGVLNSVEQQTGGYNRGRDGLGLGEEQIAAAQERIRRYLSDLASDDFVPAGRPRYGAVDYARDTVGAAEGYGKSFLVVKEHVKHRALFVSGDSFANVGLGTTTYSHIGKVLTNSTEGQLRGLHQHATTEGRGPLTVGRGTYFEAQLYTPVRFDRDVAEINLDMRELSSISDETLSSAIAALRQFADKQGVELVVRPWDPALELPFEEGEKAVDENDHRVEAFVRDVVAKAVARHAAGSHGLVVHAQGGGNGGIAGRGADASGLQRATAVGRLLRRQLDAALPSWGVPAHFVSVSQPTSRGRRLDGAVTGDPAAARRRVAVRVEERAKPTARSVPTLAVSGLPEGRGEGHGRAGGEQAQRFSGGAVRDVLPVSGQTRSDVESWIGDLNNDGDASVAPVGERLTNCGPTTWAVFDRLSGIPSFGRAHPAQLRAQDVGDAAGLPLQASNPDGIAEQLRESGVGAHTVVVAQFDNGVAHSFNALFDGDGVWAIDGQHGTVTAWPPDLSSPDNPVTNWFAGTSADRATGVDPRETMVSGLGGDRQHQAHATDDGPDTGESTGAANVSSTAADPAGTAADSLYLPFDQHAKTVSPVHDGTISAFANQVVAEAQRRREAGQPGVALNVEGGGNGGLRSQGPDVVGVQRAQAVLDAVRPQIEERLRQQGLPADLVGFSDPTTRGKNLTDDIPGTDQHTRRRVVVARVEDQPQQTASMPLDGDGWVMDSDGIPHWGRYGAAGLLLRARGYDGAPVVLLQRRAQWSDQGGTWGLPGGARNLDESVEQAALRETQEETGLHGDRLQVRRAVETARARGIDWTYSTVIGDAPYPLRAESNGEGALRWVRVDDVAGMRLHPGFAASWDGLRDQLEEHPMPHARPSAQLDPTIIPTDVRGVYAVDNPEGAIYYRDDDDVLYREDDRPPEVIFEEGFAVNADFRYNSKVSHFISTTRNPDLGYLRARSGGPVYRYTIDAPGGVDVNRTVGIGPAQYQQEISFPGGIRRENIRSAVEVLPHDEQPGNGVGPVGFRYGPVVENRQHFNPDIPNDGAPPLLLGPIGGREDLDDVEAASSLSSGSSIRFGNDEDGFDAWDQYIAALEGSPDEPHPGGEPAVDADSSGSLYLPFDQHAKTVSPVHDGTISAFANQVVAEAQRRREAGQPGVALNVEGGGNGGLRSQGPDVVGVQRAQAVLDAVRPQIEERLRQQGLPADLVGFSDPTTRGKSLTDDIPGTDQHTRRRVVVARVEDQPQQSVAGDDPVVVGDTAAAAREPLPVGAPPPPPPATATSTAPVSVPDAATDADAGHQDHGGHSTDTHDGVDRRGVDKGKGRGTEEQLREEDSSEYREVDAAYERATDDYLRALDDPAAAPGAADDAHAALMAVGDHRDQLRQQFDDRWGPRPVGQDTVHTATATDDGAVAHRAVTDAPPSIASQEPTDPDPSDVDAGDGVAPANDVDLDHDYGPLVGPKRVKDQETGGNGLPQINPAFYLLSEMPPAVMLSHTDAQWHYTVGAAGEIRIGSEELGQMLTGEELLDHYANHHLGERPDIDDPAVQEFLSRVDGQGHPTIAVEFTDLGKVADDAPPSRVSGEIGWNHEAERWELNDKSGRYMSKTVRVPLPEASDLRRWIGNVAARLADHLGEPVTPIVIKHAEPTGVQGDPNGPQTAVLDTSAGLAEPAPTAGEGPTAVDPALIPPVMPTGPVSVLEVGVTTGAAGQHGLDGDSDGRDGHVGNDIGFESDSDSAYVTADESPGGSEGFEGSADQDADGAAAAAHLVSDLVDPLTNTPTPPVMPTGLVSVSEVSVLTEAAGDGGHGASGGSRDGRVGNDFGSAADADAADDDGFGESEYLGGSADRGAEGTAAGPSRAGGLGLPVAAAGGDPVRHGQPLVSGARRDTQNDESAPESDGRDRSGDDRSGDTHADDEPNSAQSTSAEVRDTTRPGTNERDTTRRSSTEQATHTAEDRQRAEHERAGHERTERDRAIDDERAASRRARVARVAAHVDGAVAEELGGHGEGRDVEEGAAGGSGHGGRSWWERAWHTTSMYEDVAHHGDRQFWNLLEGLTDPDTAQPVIADMQEAMRTLQGRIGDGFSPSAGSWVGRGGEEFSGPADAERAYRVMRANAGPLIGSALESVSVLGAAPNRSWQDRAEAALTAVAMAGALGAPYTVPVLEGDPNYTSLLVSAHGKIVPRLVGLAAYPRVNRRLFWEYARDAPLLWLSELPYLAELRHPQLEGALPPEPDRGGEPGGSGERGPSSGVEPERIPNAVSRGWVAGNTLFAVGYFVGLGYGPDLVRGLTDSRPDQRALNHGELALPSRDGTGAGLVTREEFRAQVTRAADGLQVVLAAQRAFRAAGGQLSVNLAAQIGHAAEDVKALQELASRLEGTPRESSSFKQWVTTGLSIDTNPDLMKKAGFAIAHAIPHSIAITAGWILNPPSGGSATADYFYAGVLRAIGAMMDPDASAADAKEIFNNLTSELLGNTPIDAAVIGYHTRTGGDFWENPAVQWPLTAYLGIFSATYAGWTGEHLADGLSHLIEHPPNPGPAIRRFGDFVRHGQLWVPGLSAAGGFSGPIDPTQTGEALHALQQLRAADTAGGQLPAPVPPSPPTAHPTSDVADPLVETPMSPVKPTVPASVSDASTIPDGAGEQGHGGDSPSGGSRDGHVGNDIGGADDAGRESHSDSDSHPGSDFDSEQEDFAVDDGFGGPEDLGVSADRGTEGAAVGPSRSGGLGLPVAAAGGDLDRGVHGVDTQEGGERRGVDKGKGKATEEQLRDAELRDIRKVDAAYRRATDAFVTTSEGNAHPEVVQQAHDELTAVSDYRDQLREQFAERWDIPDDAAADRAVTDAAPSVASQEPTEPYSSDVDQSGVDTPFAGADLGRPREDEVHADAAASQPQPTPGQRLAGYRMLAPGLTNVVTRAVPTTDLAGAHYDYLTRFPRTQNGELTEAAVAQFNRDTTDGIETDLENLRRRAGIFVHGVDDQTLGELLAQDPRYLANYPELRTYLSRSEVATTADGNIGQMSGDRVRIAEVDVAYLFSPTDPTVPPRRELVERALRTLDDAGYRLPPRLRVDLLRYHRKLDVRQRTDADGPYLDIAQSSAGEDILHSEVASFLGPDLMIVSPLVSASKLPGVTPHFSKGGLAAEVEDSALAIMLHEMMHWLHYQGSPHTYTDLFSTDLRVEHAGPVGAVSRYARENPTEFVAEYGVGRILGRQYDDPEVAARLEELNEALGGPLPENGAHPAVAPAPTAAELDYLAATPALEGVDIDEIARIESALPAFDQWRSLADRAQLIDAAKSTQINSTSAAQWRSGSASHGSPQPEFAPDAAHSASDLQLDGELNETVDQASVYAASPSHRLSVETSTGDSAPRPVESASTVGAARHRLYVPFDERSKSLGAEQRAEVEGFAGQVVERAAQQHAAGSAGVVVSAEGGGNGGWPLLSRGAPVVGERRANAVLALLGHHISRALRERGLPAELVQISPVTSRGTGSTIGIPASGREARRVVVLGVDDQPVVRAPLAALESDGAREPSGSTQGSVDDEAQQYVDAHVAVEPPTPPAPSDPSPQPPTLSSPNLVIEGMDSIEEFRSGESGDAGLSHIREVIIRQGGAEVWERNRAEIIALFSDDGIRPHAPGMLRGGRAIVHVVSTGPGRALAIELQLDGSATESELRFVNEETRDGEFEQTSDSTVDAGRQTESRVVALGGVQGAITHPNATDTAALLISRERQRIISQQRADRQISGARNEEPATRLEGRIQAVITTRPLQRGGGPTEPSRAPRRLTKRPPHERVPRPDRAVSTSRTISYRAVVLVPTRVVLDRTDYGEARDVLGPLPDRSADQPGGGPLRVQHTRSLGGSDAVGNFWMLHDDDASEPLSTARPRRQTTGGFVTGAPMKAAFETAFGKRAELAMRETNNWLTVELIQAHLHGMTNKQPLVRTFETIPGARLEVHGFIEPIGTPLQLGSTDSPAAPAHAAAAQMMRSMGTTSKTEFHYGSEIDVTRVEQDSVTWSSQLPIPGRFRGGDGTETGDLVGGLDATYSRGRVRNEAWSRQLRSRNTLKTGAVGQAWHGQVRLQVVMYGPKALAARETRGRFDVMSERDETSPISDFTGHEVWAPPVRIWGQPPGESRSVSTNRWGTHSGNPSDRATTPRSNRTSEARGLGSMDRVTNLDLGGFRGLLDAMGRRAFADSWAAVGPQVSTWFHLNRIRSALPGMTQHSPLTLARLSGLNSSHAVALTADFEKLTFSRVLTTLASPSYEVTEGPANTVTDNGQLSGQLALGGRGGDIAGGTVLGEVIAGGTHTLRTGDRVRNRRRVAVGTKFDQQLALFDGWVRLDASMTGPKATVHDSGLFRVEIAIPLTELQGSRTHHAVLPPTFTREHPRGLVTLDPAQRETATPTSEAVANGQDSATDSVRPVMDWTEPARPEHPPQPPAHALEEAWHPSDMVIGVEQVSGLLEAIRHDLAPLLGGRIDVALADVAAAVGPDVLVARLVHESGREWSQNISIAGGSITVKVRPVREAAFEYVGPSEKFELDLITESFSSTAVLISDVKRAVVGGRLQIPFPHGSVAVQLTNTSSRRPAGSVTAGGGDAGDQRTDADNDSAVTDTESRMTLRNRNVQPYDLYRQPIRFEIGYEAHGSAVFLTHSSGYPVAPRPVKLDAVFAYPRRGPVAAGIGSAGQGHRLELGQFVVAVRPSSVVDTSAARARSRDGERTPGEDLIGTHILDSLSAEGRIVFGADWPNVRAELSSHVNTSAIHSRLAEFGTGAVTVIDLTSVRGGRVRLGGTIISLSDGRSDGVSEFYRGGQTIRSVGLSNTQASNWQGYLQVQGDVIPGSGAVNLSVLGRVDLGVGGESTNTATDVSAIGLQVRQRAPAIGRTGAATVEAWMSRPEGLLRLSGRAEHFASANIDFATHEAVKGEGTSTYRVEGDHTGRLLSYDTIVRRIVGGNDIRSTALESLGGRVDAGTRGSIQGDVTDALNDTRLAKHLPEMTRSDVELFRRGSLSITARAEMQPLKFRETLSGKITHNSLNEVNQVQGTHAARIREGGARLLLGPHWTLPDFSGALVAGVGISGRQRVGPLASQTAKVTANSRYANPHVVFDGQANITLTVRDGGRSFQSRAVTVSGQFEIPMTETQVVNEPVTTTIESAAVPTQDTSAVRDPRDPGTGPFEVVDAADSSSSQGDWSGAAVSAETANTVSTQQYSADTGPGAVSTAGPSRGGISGLPVAAGPRVDALTDPAGDNRNGRGGSARSSVDPGARP